MALKSMRYDHPTYTARHFVPVQVKAVAASTSAFRFAAFSAMKVKSVTGIVNIAGTNTAAGWDILNGTTSVGAITAGTSAAAAVLTAFSGDVSLAAGGFLDIKTKANSATLAGDFNIEFEIDPGSDVTE